MRVCRIFYFQEVPPIPGAIGDVGEPFLVFMWKSSPIGGVVFVAKLNYWQSRIRSAYRRPSWIIHSIFEGVFWKKGGGLFWEGVVFYGRVFVGLSHHILEKILKSLFIQVLPTPGVNLGGVRVS